VVKDIESARRKGKRFIDYEFSVRRASGSELKVAISANILEEVISAKFSNVKHVSTFVKYELTILVILAPHFESRMIHLEQ
jgi:hypothetical protein